MLQRTIAPFTFASYLSARALSVAKPCLPVAGRLPTAACLLATYATGCGTSPQGSSAATGGASSTSSSPSDATSSATLDATTTTSAASSAGTNLDGSFVIEATLAPKIQTVAVVEWSFDKPVDEAVIEFGRSGQVEYTAPVDLAAPKYRTLLLGMKQDTEYTFVVKATSSGSTYRSPPQTIISGFLPNGLPTISVTDSDASKLYGGFTVTCNGVGTGVPGQPMSQGGDAYAFIFDKDGEYIWALPIEDSPVGECTRARFSWNGDYLWLGNFNNVNTKGALQRITLDGENETDYSFPGRHHDFTVLPDNKVLFHEQEDGGGTIGNEGADIVKVLDPVTGVATELYHERTDFSDIADDPGCHTNYITYIPEIPAFSISMRHSDTIALLSYPDAALLGVFNGIHDEFGVEWDAQHGHQFLGNRLLVFNNADSESQSHVLEYEFDLGTKTVTELPRYSGDEKSGAFGDVQRLPNGNTFITYSNSGIIHEIDPDRNLLRETKLGPVGYSTHRKSMYGVQESSL